MASCKGIRTSHAGSLPRPPRLIELNARRGRGEIEEGEYEDGLAEAVAGVVGRQREVGIDLVNDGEYGHSMRTAYDYGAWWSYVFPRLGGLELVDVALRDTVQARRPAAPGEVALASFGSVATGTCSPTPMATLAAASRCRRQTSRCARRCAVPRSATSVTRRWRATSPT